MKNDFFKWFSISAIAASSVELTKGNQKFLHTQYTISPLQNELTPFSFNFLGCVP